jgi:hypothetical protein
MLNKKRALGSVGAGILIFVSGMFFILLVYKLLNSPLWLITGSLWLLGWPFWLVTYVVCIPLTAKASLAIALSTGVAADIAILSGLVYATLSLFSRSLTRPTPPPPPASFD